MLMSACVYACMYVGICTCDCVLHMFMCVLVRVGLGQGLKASLFRRLEVRGCVCGWVVC